MFLKGALKRWITALLFFFFEAFAISINVVWNMHAYITLLKRVLYCSPGWEISSSRRGWLVLHYIGITLLQQNHSILRILLSNFFSSLRMILSHFFKEQNSIPTNYKLKLFDVIWVILSLDSSCNIILVVIFLGLHNYDKCMSIFITYAWKGEFAKQSMFFKLQVLVSKIMWVKRFVIEAITHVQISFNGGS